MIISGIYQIVNKINNKSYIGGSKDIIHRWKTHKYQLNHSRHHCIPLQRAWAKYGIDNLILKIIEKFSNPSPKELLEKEQKWIEKISPEYNVGSVGGGDNISSHPNLKNIKLKHSINGKKHWEAKTEAQKKKYSLDRIGSKNGHWKGGVSNPECKICKKPIFYGHIHCSYCSKLGENNPFFGKSHSPETKEKIRLKNKGKKPANSNPIVINNRSFLSQADAAREFNVSIGTISNWVTGKIIKKGISIQQKGPL